MTKNSLLLCLIILYSALNAQVASATEICNNHNNAITYNSWIPKKLRDYIHFILHGYSQYHELQKEHKKHQEFLASLIVLLERITTQCNHKQTVHMHLQEQIHQALEQQDQLDATFMEMYQSELCQNTNP